MRTGPGRSLVVLLMALFVLGAIALAGVPPATDSEDPSSHSAGRAGTLALYTWLSELGFATGRLDSTLDLGATDVLISVAPQDRFEPEEVDAVMAHLTGGGDAILTVDAGRTRPALPLLRRLGIEVTGDVDAPRAVPPQPIDAGARVTTVPLGVSATVKGGPEAVTLLSAAGTGVAAARRVAGRGRAYVLGTSFPLSNDGLRQPGSAELVLSLLERARGGRVTLDELHHGSSHAHSGAAAILDGPLGLAALLGALLLVVHLTLSGRRLGRPLPAAGAADVPSLAGYIDAMAALQAGSRRRGGVADRYGDELKTHVSAATGLDPRLPDDAFMGEMACRGGVGEQVARLLARARELARGEPSEAELVALAGEIDAAESEYDPGSPRHRQWRS